MVEINNTDMLPIDKFIGQLAGINELNIRMISLYVSGDERFSVRATKDLSPHCGRTPTSTDKISPTAATLLVDRISEPASRNSHQIPAQYGGGQHARLALTSHKQLDST